ncbi:hypothetical protein DJ59_3824 [Yersinia enterocolitica]|nr:hypothetical protein DJ59_3824 [Yersinia enterocolitica]
MGRSGLGRRSAHRCSRPASHRAIKSALPENAGTVIIGCFCFIYRHNIFSSSFRVLKALSTARDFHREMVSIPNVWLLCGEVLRIFALLQGAN